MKILIVTDAAAPQINGVVRTLEEVAAQIKVLGHEVDFLTFDEFKTFSVSIYPELKLSWNIWNFGNIIKTKSFDTIHIATEGPLGFAARLYCRKHKIKFTSSYHTKMPEYINKFLPFIPQSLVYAYLRWLHKPSTSILVTTQSMKNELIQHKFKNNLVVWSRGVNFDIFNPERKSTPPPFTNVKMLLYVGRLSQEKNIEAFLNLYIPNTVKVIIGDGPERVKLQKEHQAVFLGYKSGSELAKWMANADVFVFPSKTDTFGIVMIEAAACGTPIAAYPVTGPIDFVQQNVNGYLDNDLKTAVLNALKVNRTICYQHIKNNYSWIKCAKILIEESQSTL